MVRTSDDLYRPIVRLGSEYARGRRAYMVHKNIFRAVASLQLSRIVTENETFVGIRRRRKIVAGNSQ